MKIKSFITMWCKASDAAKMFIVIAIAFMCLSTQYVSAYSAISKENVFADVLLTELLNRMDRNSDSMNNYFDIDTELPTKGLDLVPRSSKNNMPADFDYHNLSPYNGGGGGGGVGDVASSPTIRDQEYLQRNALWGHQYVSGGMGEVPNRFSTIVKTDASLPAYCNPPNPCPVGYEDSKGCISDFENTAIFSREFQAAQDCTCDSEHMFDCRAQDNSDNDNEMIFPNMEKFLMHQFQNENSIDSNNNGAVVKKFYNFDGGNPFLQGEKLPIAAKKGDNIPL